MSSLERPLKRKKKKHETTRRNTTQTSRNSEILNTSGTSGAADINSRCSSSSAGLCFQRTDHVPSTTHNQQVQDLARSSCDGEVDGQTMIARTGSLQFKERQSVLDSSDRAETKNVAGYATSSYNPTCPLQQSRKTGKPNLPIVVVAIDFGTAYSGYAFSFFNEPEKVYTNSSWYEGFLKTATCLLLTTDKMFDSFGFEAENKFSNLTPCEQKEWYFFRNFKMLLYSQGLTRNSMISDINGKQMQAMTVFAMSIDFLRKHFLETLEKSKRDIAESDVKYVLTVPSIWSDRAKQFMREAGIKAGIDSGRLVLALEPEAASIWCQTYHLEVKVDLGKSLTSPGTSFMVADLGGGTADFSVFERMPDKSLRQLRKASGGPWGGNVVNENYFKWLIEIFGGLVMDKFKADEVEAYFEMQREFERKKRFIKTTNEKVSVQIPASLREMSEEIEKQNVSKKQVDNPGKETFTFGGDKLRISASVVRQWFDEPITCIVKHMKEILADPEMRHVNIILLVGGFSECQLVQNRIRTEIQSHQLVFPQEPGLAVLKGAVLFGNNPDVISTRIANYSYGMNSVLPFEPDLHPLSKLIFIDGKPFAKDIFGVFVKAGEKISVGHEEKRIITPTKNNETNIHIFTSNSLNPMFTDEDGCNKIGFLRVIHPGKGTREDKEFELTFFFGRTDLQVSASLIKGRTACAISVDCL